MMAMVMETIGFLKEGWNPLYEHMSDFNDDKPVFDGKSSSFIWGDHYAKGSHIFAANVYAFTDKIESGKSINTLSIIMLFCFGLSLLLHKNKNVLFSFFFALCLVGSSVVVSQFLTYYVDLLLYIYLTIIIMYFFFAEKQMKDSKNIIESQNVGLLLFIFSLVILINVKFTAFAYAGLFCLGYYIWYIVRLKLKTIDKKFFIKFTISAAIAVILGVFVVGLSVYPKNLLDHGHPFYPIMGKGKIDIMTNNSPAYFKDKSPIEKFTIATFSKRANISKKSGLEAEFKFPFIVYESEIKSLYGCDIRISGNGVLFSGILIISLLVLVCTAKKVYKKDKTIFWLTMIPLAITFAMIFLISESWWARYFPQLYYFVLAAILCLKIVDDKNKTCYLIIYLIFVNSFMIFDQATKYVLNYTREVNRSIEVFKSDALNNERCIPQVYTTNFHGAFFNVVDILGEDSPDILKPLVNYNANDYHNLIKNHVVWRCKNDEIYKNN